MPNVIRPIDFTLNNTTNSNTKDSQSGTVFFNASFFWVTGAYRGPYDLTRRRTFVFDTGSVSSSTSGWLGGFGISTVSASEFYNASTLKALISRISGSLTSAVYGASGALAINGSQIGRRMHSLTVNEDGSIEAREYQTLLHTFPAGTLSSDYYIKALGGAYFHDPTTTTSRTNTSCVFVNSFEIMHDVAAGQSQPTVGQLFPLMR